MNVQVSGKIGLFGGAFDPVHIGHQQVARNILNQQIVDEVWFVPVFKHPWAQKMGKEFLTPYQDRVRMIALTIENLLKENPDLADRVKLAHFENVSFTYDTLEYFSAEHPTAEFFWIMGSEYLPKFELFLADHPKLTDYQFYIYPRSGHPMEPLYPNMKALANMEEISASSTQVREKVKQGESISHLVPAEVDQYIAQNKLYL